MKPISGPETLRSASLIVCLIVAAGLAVPAIPQEPEKEPTPIEKEMTTIRKMMFNADLKVRKGAVDVAPGSAVPNGTPAQLCCSGNLEHIGKSISALREIVRERTTCFERKRDIQGVEISNLVVRDMRGLESSLQLFVESEDRRSVRGAMDSATRAYLKLNETLGVLPECGKSP